MTESEFHLFLNAAIFLCAAMAMFNVFRHRKRGLSAYLVSTACLAAGLTLYLLREKTSEGTVYAAGGAVVVLLIADVIVRARDAEIKRGGDK